jgi:hypothetical protein
MDIQAEKLQLIEQLIGLQDINTIQKVKEALNYTNLKTPIGYNTDGSEISQPELVARAKASNQAIKEGRTKSISGIRESLKNW